MNDMTIEFDFDGNHYVYEMHSITGENVRQYIISNQDADFITAVMMCGELINMYPLNDGGEGQ